MLHFMVEITQNHISSVKTRRTRKQHAAVYKMDTKLIEISPNMHPSVARTAYKQNETTRMIA